MALSTRLTTACSRSGGLIGANTAAEQATSRAMPLARASILQTSVATCTTSQTSASSSGAASSWSGLQRGEREQIGDDRVETVGLAGDDAQESASRVGVVGGAVQQGLGEALDRRHGGLEFVRDVGDEVAPHRLEPLEPGHVVEDDDRADPAVVVSTLREGAVPPGACGSRRPREREFAFHRGVPYQRLGDDVLELGVAHEVLDGAPMAAAGRCRAGAPPPRLGR